MSQVAGARDLLLAQKASLVAERFLHKTQEAASALAKRTVELEEWVFGESQCNTRKLESDWRI